MKKYLNVYSLLFPFFTSIIIYVNSLQNSFVYDDESTVINNYFIRNWSNLPNLFTSKYFSLSAELTYRPVVTVSYFIDYAFWHLNPTGYHLTNVLLHAINSTLFFVFAFQIFKNRTTALISALFFSSHPLFSEVVNAIGFREDLLAFMFLILAFMCYFKANQQRYILYYSLSLFCYLFSLFSKEMAITLPILIILYDVIFQKLSQGNENLSNRIRFSCLKLKFLHYYVGYFLITIFYILNRFLFFHNPLEAQIPYPQNSFFVNFLTMPHVLAFYVKLFFLPFNLNADYVVTFCTSIVKTSLWLSFVLFIAIGIFSFRIRSQHRYVCFFILWFFVTLIPVMNIIPLGNIMAERYLYIPGAGFCMIISCLLSRKQIKHISSSPIALIHPTFIYQRRIKKYFCDFSLSSLSLHFIFILFFILMGNAYLTCRRNNDWKDGLWLWSKTTLTSPNSFRAHINLGNAYEKKGLDSAAHGEYKRALSINPNDADVYNNLGIYYNKMNRFDDSIQYFIKCLTIKPQHARAYNNLGVVFTKQRQLDNAIQAFSKAISINPLYPDAHNNLGIAYYRRGLMDEAEREFKLAINIEPYHAEAHNDLGILYNDRHLFDDAIKEFELAIQIRPNYANAHMNLGALLLKQKKDKNRALFHLKESLKIDPLQEQANGIHKLIQKLENESGYY